MTAHEVRRLSWPALAELYSSLRADRLPVGTYDGVTWPVPVWPLWRGKVFTVKQWESARLHRVRNRIGPWLFVDGKLYWWPTTREVEIRYPFGLTDKLRPVSDSLWLGYLLIFWRWRIWFTLERVP